MLTVFSTVVFFLFSLISTRPLVHVGLFIVCAKVKLVKESDFHQVKYLCIFFIVCAKLKIVLVKES